MKFLWIEDKPDGLSNGIWIDDITGENAHNNPISIEACRLELDAAHEKYDFIIFDLNLEDWFEEEKIEDWFKKEKVQELNEKVAGYDLYLEAAFAGFPRDRMIFLTANVSDDDKKKKEDLLVLQKINNPSDPQLQQLASKYEVYDSDEQGKWSDWIKERRLEEIKSSIRKDIEKNSSLGNTFHHLKTQCSEARIELPQCFPKGERGKDEFVKWVTDCVSVTDDEKRYMVLRRGIIEGCDDAISKLENITDASDIPFHKGINDNRNFQIEKNKNYFIEYFYHLKTILPLRMPVGDSFKNQIRVFIKELSADWDSKNGRVERGCNDEYLSFCHQQMKVLRNWITHGILCMEKEDVKKIINFVALHFSFSSQAIAGVRVSEKFEPIFDQVGDINVSFLERVFGIHMEKLLLPEKGFCFLDKTNFFHTGKKLGRNNSNSYASVLGFIKKGKGSIDSLYWNHLLFDLLKEKKPRVLKKIWFEQTLDSTKLIIEPTVELNKIEGFRTQGLNQTGELNISKIIYNEMFQT